MNGYAIQTNTSDRNLKENIEDSEENALDKIKSIQHRKFDWIKDGTHQKNGVIAQELEEIDEEFVIKTTFENETKYSINILNLLTTTTKAMQEQQLLIEQMQQKIIELEEKLNG